MEGTAFLESLDPSINTIDRMPERVTDLESLCLDRDYRPSGDKSVLLIDNSERLCYESEQTFLKALKLETNKKVKVVSIFGNTGEGKSHTFNHTFFDGQEIFETSQSQTSCTMGVWAKYDPKMNVICLDTEGMLGISGRESQRTRLLLKVLAISDIIIYRTRAERIQRDMYSFLGSASKVYREQFNPVLKKTIEKMDLDKSMQALGPAIIVFHETQHTKTLCDDATVNESAEEILRNKISLLNLNIDAFSSIKYVGVQSKNSVTSFETLKVSIQKELESTEVRSPREAKYVYLILRSLNEKFRNPLSEPTDHLFISTFFSCQEKCQSCKNRCTLSVGHSDNNEVHVSNDNCIFQHQYQNMVYLCKKCIRNGHKSAVKANYASGTESSWASYVNGLWSGYSLDCPVCGEIYRSRQHWFGNKHPEECAVVSEVVHVWTDEPSFFGRQNTAQRVLDSVAHLTDVVTSVSAPPTLAFTNWMADQIAPSYWIPNHEIKACHKCDMMFGPTDRKHHCRACGQGFCEACSSKRQPVPSKGWTEDVRVCDDCFTETPSLSQPPAVTENRARVIGETVVNSVSAVKTVFTDFIKDSARPTYWIPDSECVACIVCQKSFGPLLQLHHCRKCGKGVCDSCSRNKKPVPLHGWDTPVRVCDNCCGT